MSDGQRPGAVVADVMVRRPKTLGTDATAADVEAFFADDHVHQALVVGPDGRLVTTVERTDLTVGVPPATPATALGRLAGRTVAPTDPLDPITATLHTERRRRLAVVDTTGHLLGLLCLKRSGTGYCTDEGIRERAEERRAHR